MGLINQLSDDLAEVDIIVVGGGAAGCVIASRLSDAEPDLSILVVESGPDNCNEPTIQHPALFMSHFQPNRFNKFYPSPASEFLNGRETPMWVGNVLGGGTSINTMMYTRPPATDFDDWKTSGWSGEDMMQYFRKLETYHGEGDPAHHGSGGPVEISRGTHVFETARDDLLNVANKIGWPEQRDLQSMQADAAHGSQKALRYVSKEGIRQDAATCYLHPRLEDGRHPNLHGLIETEVGKVLMEKGKAVGITYRPKADSDSPDAQRQVRARKLVVLSAGAFGSATILERSGIGSADILAQAGVSVVQDLPGVGSNYMDHTILVTAYETDLRSDETMDAMAKVNPEELIKQNSPLLGTNGQDVNIKGRPSEVEAEALGPAFVDVWKSQYATRPEKPVGWMSLIGSFPGYEPTIDPNRAYLGMLHTIAYPLSSGSMHITGSTLSDRIDFDPGFLSDNDQVDVKMLLWVYKKARELARRMKTFRGEFTSWHPAFPEGSKAAAVKTAAPLPDDAPDLEYSPEDDAAIEKFIRDKIVTMNHSMGTCKMAPLQEGGVVDPKLNVYGIQGLKVADLSIVPRNVAANTASTALAIGEKAADLILEELRS